MARRPSKRMRDAAARRKQIESPPRRRAADARAASQRHAEQSAAGTDRGVVTCGWCGATVPVPAADVCPSGARHHAGTAPGSRDEPRPQGSQPSKWWTGASKSAARSQRSGGWWSTDLRSRLHGPVEEWARLLEELAARLDRGTIYNRQLPAMRPAVAALVDSFNRRWS